MNKAEKVAILGASNNSERYSYLAQELLVHYGHQVYPVNPKDQVVAGARCYKSLTDINEQIDTITVYVNAKRLAEYVPEIIKIHPKRVILNPGTEDEKIENDLKGHGIQVYRACTLVLLKTGQY